MRDIVSHLAFRSAFPPAAAVADNTPLVSQIVDRRGFESVALAIATGVLSDADATFAVVIEHGDAPNLSDATEASAIQMNGLLSQASFDFSADNSTRKIGYVGSKRYVRARITPSNNAGNAFIAGIWVLGTANEQPTGI